jgi:ABC-type glucose/galactose transport system permease subunit
VAPARRIDVSNVRIPGTSLQGGRAVAVGAVVLFVLLFIAANDRRLKVDFLIFSVQSNELLALILIAGLGFAAGFMIASRRTPPASAAIPPRPALETDAAASEKAPPAANS